MNDVTKKVVNLAGGKVALAKRLGVTRQAVSKWTHVPAQWVRLLEELTGIPAEQMRPDIFARPTKHQRRVSHAAA